MKGVIKIVKNKVLMKRSQKKDKDLEEVVAVYRDKNSGEIFFETEFWIFFKNKTIRRNRFKGTDSIKTYSNKINPHWETLMERYVN